MPPGERGTRKRIPRSTLSEWKERGFIDLAQKHADPHKAAALRIARILVNLIDPERERQWLHKGKIKFMVEEEILERQKLEHISLLALQKIELEQRQECEKAAAIQEEIEKVHLLSLQQSDSWRVCWHWDPPAKRDNTINYFCTSLIPPLLPLPSGSLANSIDDVAN